MAIGMRGEKAANIVGPTMDKEFKPELSDDMEVRPLKEDQRGEMCSPGNPIRTLIMTPQMLAGTAPEAKPYVLRAVYFTPLMLSLAGLAETSSGVFRAMRKT